MISRSRIYGYSRFRSAASSHPRTDLLPNVSGKAIPLLGQGGVTGAERKRGSAQHQKRLVQTTE